MEASEELNDPASYRITEEIGVGPTSVVYKAECIPRNRTMVAIKVIDFMGRLTEMRFFKSRAEAHHGFISGENNILKFHCMFPVGTCLWIIMPFLSGGSLLSLMGDSGEGLPEAFIIPILKRLLQILSYLQDSIIGMHIDLKASNILFDSEGSVVIADLGISASHVQESQALGVPLYWEAEGKDVRRVTTDYEMWSFGMLALELARGCPGIGHLPLSKLLMRSVSLRFGFRDRYHKWFMGLDFSPFEFSSDFKNLIKLCLSLNPEDRPNPTVLLQHPLITNCDAANSVIKSVIKCRTEKVPADEELKIERWEFDEQSMQMRPVYAGGSNIGTLKKIQNLYMHCLKESILRSVDMENELEKINFAIALQETGEAGPSHVAETYVAAETSLEAQLEGVVDISSFLALESGEAGPAQTDAAAELEAELEAGLLDISSLLD